MFTEQEKKEHARLMQKRRRANPTATRKAMLNWSGGPLGKAAKKKWMANGGAEHQAEYRAPGTLVYALKREKNNKSITAAEKSRVHWTLSDELQLLKLHHEGIPATQIAKLLSRSIEAVEHKREKLKKSISTARAKS